MKSSRLEALTDGVVAIIITIMVLELKVPEGGDLSALSASAPMLLVYALSFVSIGIFWNNHQHLFQASTRIDGRVVWANLFLLFWLGLLPFMVRWLDESVLSVGATAAFGIVLGMAAIGYELTQRAIIASNGADSAVARAVGSNCKGTISLAIYSVAVPLSFGSRWAAMALYAAVILLWMLADRRIERALHDGQAEHLNS
jgi:uncharacterized membrane protein